MSQKVIEDFYENLCENATRLGRIGEKPTVLLAILNYMIEENVFGKSLLELLGSKHIDKIRPHFLAIARGRLKSPFASWNMVIKKDKKNMMTTVKEYITLTGKDVSTSFSNLTKKGAEHLISRYTETTMIGSSELARLHKELQKPRKELNGESYADYRKDRFATRYAELPSLLSKRHIPNLTLTEAQTIFEKATSGERQHRERFMKLFIANGIDKIRVHFYDLLYGTNRLDERFDDTIANLSQVNTDLSSTLLHLIDPTKYPIWNAPVTKALEMIGRPLIKIGKESKGRQYERLIGICEDIANELNIQQLDVVDSLLYLIWEGSLRIKEPPQLKQKPRVGVKVRPPLKGGIPEKIRVQTSAYQRNESIVRAVKDAEYWTCQVCGQPIISPLGKYYCEAHHIQPLNEGGKDDASNVLCLCPNHHAEMHNGLFYIEPRSKQIVYHDIEHIDHGKDLCESRNPECEFHHVSAKYLRYHCDNIFGKK